MDKSRRVSIPAPLYERLEKVAEKRLVGVNLLVTRAVDRIIDELETTPLP